MFEFCPYPDFRSAADDVLRYLRSRLGFGLWMVTRTENDAWIVLQSLDSDSGVRDGDVFRWAASAPARGGLAPFVAPRATELLVHESPRPGKQLAVAAYVGVPLVRADGSLFGSLCAVDSSPQSNAISAELPTIELLARMLSTVLQAELKAAAEARRAERANVDALGDALTGLNNRRAWDKLLQTEESRCRRYGHAACVIALDLDGLKQVNDALGHSAGDELLAKAGSLLRSSCRAEDIVARVGGDEFAILAVETSLPQGEAFVGRLESVFASEGVEISIGLAARTPAGSLEETWREADRLMYEAKRLRRAARLRASRKAAPAPVRPG